MALLKPRDFGSLLRQAGTQFMADDTFQEGAALAYYSIFALPALLVLITRLVGGLFGPALITGALYREVSKLVGPSAAVDIEQMVAKATHDQGFTVAAAVGLVTLLLAATGVFMSMQETLNAIWGVKAKPKKAWLKIVLDRLRGLGLILAVGALLLISLVAQALLSGMQAFLKARLPGADVIWLHVTNQVSSIGLSMILFASIFRFLPDARIRWRSVWAGALLTAVLFALGKALIGYYLGHSNLGSVYGAAGTVIVLLSWVFYTSQILFFGAVFTRCYAERYGEGIRPSAHAVRVKVVEVTDDNEVTVKHEPNAPTDGVKPETVAEIAKLGEEQK